MTFTFREYEKVVVQTTIVFVILKLIGQLDWPWEKVFAAAVVVVLMEAAIWTFAGLYVLVDVLIIGTWRDWKASRRAKSRKADETVEEMLKRMRA